MFVLRLENQPIKILDLVFRALILYFKFWVKFYDRGPRSGLAVIKLSSQFCVLVLENQQIKMLNFMFRAWFLCSKHWAKFYDFNPWWYSRGTNFLNSIKPQHIVPVLFVCFAFTDLVSWTDTPYSFLCCCIIFIEGC